MNDFQRIPVWSGWMRLAHWSIGLSVLVLIATGWLVGHAPSVATGAGDLHAIAASVLMAAMVLRIWLLLADKGVGGWEALVPSKGSVSGARQMLMFYFTLGRAPLPNWFGHNPLWVPLYALLYLSLLVMAVTGLFMQEHPVMAGLYLPGIHEAFASIILGFTIVHVITVAMHDIKGEGADVSAMLNGHKLFRTGKPESIKLPEESPGIPVDSIGREKRE